MIKSLGAFRAAVLIGWLVLGIAGILYAQFKNIPPSAAFPAVVAFFISYPFYLVPAFPTLRERFSGTWLPAYLVAATVLPYLACCFGAISFQWSALGQLIALGLTFGLWYRVLPVNAIVDIAFISLIPLVLVGKFFSSIYVPLYPPLKDILFLGHVTLIEISVMALLLERRVHEAGYGFIPNRREWRIGALHFVYFLIVGGAIAMAIQAVHFNIRLTPAKGVGMFVGMFIAYLWTIALSEEFFARGVLQQWFEEWTWSRPVALAITSVLFGLVHLWFSSKFPNWRWAIVAGVLGWFCGRARNQAGSIRAGMVTHALVFSTWKVFFA